MDSQESSSNVPQSETPDLPHLGARLHWARKKCGLTLEQMSRMTEVTTSYLSRLERGERTRPTQRVLIALAFAVQVKPEWLLEGAGRPWIWLRHGQSQEQPEIERMLSLMTWLNREDVATVDQLIQTLDVLLGASAQSLHALGRIESFAARRLFNQLKLKLASAPSKLPENSLTVITEYGNAPVVKSDMAELLARLNRVSAPRGKKAELARYLGVPASTVSVWLSGAREPGGATTLKLIRWLKSQQEKQT